MRSVSFTMVKNEEDIIEAFVRHTLTQVDHLYVANNLSTDGTGDILDSLLAEGLALTVSVDAEQALLQNEKMTAMYRSYSRIDRFDFAFFLDVDEFLEVDKDKMQSIFEKYGPGRAYYIPRCNYLYMGGVSTRNPMSIFENMVVLDANKQSAKSMIFHGEKECRRFRVGNGNHHVRDWARGGMIVSEPQDEEFANILHFPIRSINQYLQKNLLGWLSLQLREAGVNEIKSTIGTHWRTQYGRILEQNAEITDDEVKRNLYSGNYADRMGPRRPFEPNFTIKYAQQIRETSVMVQLVKMYEQTIREIWRSRAEIALQDDANRDGL